MSGWDCEGIGCCCCAEAKRLRTEANKARAEVYLPSPRGIRVRE